MTELTGVPDADRLILLKLTSKTLSTLPYVSKYFYGLLNAEFWRRKILASFGAVATVGSDKEVYFTIVRSNRPHILCYSAAKYGQVEILENLLTLTKDPVKPRNPEEQLKRNLKEALSAAVNYDNEELIALLFPRLNVDRSVLKRVLYKSLFDGKYALTHYLIGLGMDVNHHSYLFNAVLSGKVSLVKLLMAHGVDVTARGGIILNLALERGHLEMSRFLLSYIDPNQVPMQGITTPLSEAVRSKKVEVVRLLLESGYEQIRKHEVCLAIRFCRLDILQLLLDYGATLKDVSTTNLIFNLIKRGHVDVLSFLYQHEPTLLIRNTPGVLGKQLLAATGNGHTKTVEFLVEHTNLDRRRIESALLVAREKNYRFIIDFLQRTLDKTPPSAVGVGSLLPPRSITDKQNI